MKFEHLIEINDLTNPTSLFISRAQLWQGLVLRAEMPGIFVPYLDEAIITERSLSGMQRNLRYGELWVQDSVLLSHEQEVKFVVPAQGEIPASSLIMKIEEPQADTLFVRFIYDDAQTQEADPETEMYNDYRRSAYQEADIDTIRTIRELAESGRLDGFAN